MLREPRSRSPAAVRRAAATLPPSQQACCRFCVTLDGLANSEKCLKSAPRVADWFPRRVLRMVFRGPLMRMGSRASSCGWVHSQSCSSFLRLVLRMGFRASCCGWAPAALVADSFLLWPSEMSLRPSSIECARVRKGLSFKSSCCQISF